MISAVKTRAAVLPQVNSNTAEPIDVECATSLHGITPITPMFIAR